MAQCRRGKRRCYQLCKKKKNSFTKTLKIILNQITSHYKLPPHPFFPSLSLSVSPDGLRGLARGPLRSHSSSLLGNYSHLLRWAFGLNHNIHMLICQFTSLINSLTEMLVTGAKKEIAACQRALNSPSVFERQLSPSTQGVNPGATHTHTHGGSAASHRFQLVF